MTNIFGGGLRYYRPKTYQHDVIYFCYLVHPLMGTSNPILWPIFIKSLLLSDHFSLGKLTKEEVVGLSLGEGLPHLGGVGLLPPPLEGEHLQSAPRAVWVPVQLCVKHEHYVDAFFIIVLPCKLFIALQMQSHNWISWCGVGSMRKWCNQMFDMWEVGNSCKIEDFEIVKIGRHNKYWVASYTPPPLWFSPLL